MISAKCQQIGCLPPTRNNNKKYHRIPVRKSFDMTWLIGFVFRIVIYQNKEN
jgi:hypothetical protein